MASQANTALSAVGVGWGMLASMQGKSEPVASTSTAVEKKSTEKKSSSWFSTNTLIGSVAAVAVGGMVSAGYFYGKDFTNWGSEHLSFLVELWKTDSLQSRLNAVEAAQKDEKDKIGFHCFYTLLTPHKDAPLIPRTFIVLPDNKSHPNFSSNINSFAQDPIQAHVDMFETKSDGYYALGKETVDLINSWL